MPDIAVVSDRFRFSWSGNVRSKDSMYVLLNKVNSLSSTFDDIGIESVAAMVSGEFKLNSLKFRKNDVSFSKKFSKLGCYDFDASTSSEENRVNSIRIQEFREKFQSNLIWNIRSESIEPGVTSRSDQIVAEAIRLNRSAAIECLVETFTDNFGNFSLAADILMLVGRIPYEVVGDTGLMMVLNGLVHKNDVVKESALRAIENWSQPEHLRLLDNVDVGTGWVFGYLNDVKEYLRSLNVEDNSKNYAL